MPRILLVDDAALTRNAMQAALEPWGIELAHAENGEVAVAKATVASSTSSCRSWMGRRRSRRSAPPA
jgi:CheY-like chemotaxis protein